MRDSVDKINSGLNQQPLKTQNTDSIKEVKDEDLKSSSKLESSNETTDLSKMPSEVLGRSQVAKDNIENDMKILLENPDVVENSNKFYDMAEEVLRANGDEHPAENAAVLTEAFRKEFLSK
ncbi:hypothetical protein IJF81_04340 [bacterium]|nr:hypothetical protein [bacterium]